MYSGVARRGKWSVCYRTQVNTLKVRGQTLVSGQKWDSVVSLNAGFDLYSRDWSTETETRARAVDKGGVRGKGIDRRCAPAAAIRFCPTSAPPTINPMIH